MDVQEVEFYFDFTSPNAYLVHKVLPGIVASMGARLTYRPMLLGGVFKETNNRPPLMAFADVAGKTDYIRLEFMRFVERHGIAFQWNPHFPVNTVQIMRGAVFAQTKAWYPDYLDACFDAIWLDEADLSDAAITTKVLEAKGLPGADILSATQLPTIKGQLAELTQSAIDRGVFGAPTMFLGAEMFFGKDALGDLEWRLGQV